jgi:nicotinate dehydrogenase subunit A
MSAISLKVNGRSQTLELDPATPLLYVLSDDLGLRGPKFGCGLAQCGSCTVLVKGRAIRSCVTPVGALAGADVTTLEGLGTPEAPHPIQKAFIEEQAAQCGFCLNGVILSAKALLDRRERPHRPARRARHRGRRNVHHRRGRGDRQRHLRCDRGARSAGAVHARARQGRAGGKGVKRRSNAGGRVARA